MSIELPVRTDLRSAEVPADGILEGPRVLRRLPEGAEERPYTLFDVRPLGRVIGAEIEGVDLGAPLTEDLRAELNRALLEWKVIFFRDQDITPAQQRDFAKNWGPLETNPFIPTGDSEEVTRFSRSAGMPGYENIWHTDVTFRPNPALGSVLRLVEVPPIGGDTMWADMAAAYDNLSDEVKERIEGLRAVHDYIPGFIRFSDREKLASHQEEFPPVEHPVVRIHPETGRRTLFVNQAFTTHIVGIDRDESDRLLRLLFNQAHVPEFQVRFQWRKNSVAFWDNRATAHLGPVDLATADFDRRVERVTLVGDVPATLRRTVMPDPKATVTAFLTALEELDVEGALSLAADDIVYQNVPLPPARGIAAVEKQLRAMARYGTGFEARTHHIAADGPIVLTERTDVLRAHAFEAEFWVCGTFEVRDEKIVLWRDYFDWATFLAASARGAGKALVAGVSGLVAKARNGG